MSFTTPQFPTPVRVGLKAWRAAARAGIGRVSLDEDSVIRAAQRKSGLNRFANDDFRIPLRRMISSLEEEARLHPLGRVAVREILVRTLVNRLRFEASVDRHPEISDMPVQSPVFVVGLQRTGTTMLHRLLTCEPKLRAMPAWEGINPSPFPKRFDRDGRDARIRPAQASVRAMNYMAPWLMAIHPVEPEEPEEDIHLLDVTLVSPAIDAIFRVPSYQQWFSEVDQLPAYHYMRRLIQFLLWQRDGRWLGKTPHHLEYLNELLTVFPDAKVVITHRDPSRTVASFCSMMAHTRAIFSDGIEGDEVGAQFGAKAVRAVERSMLARDRLDPNSFIDVLYQDVLADPLKEVRRVYDFIGLELSPETESTMQQWLRKNSQTKHGVHSYRLEDFGLDHASLDPHFDAYRSRFGIPSES